MLEISARYAISPSSMAEEIRQKLIEIRADVLGLIEKDAARCRRSTNKQIEAILMAYVGMDVEINDLQDARAKVNKPIGKLARVPASKGQESANQQPCFWCSKPSQSGICDDCKRDLTGTAKMTEAKLNNLPYGVIELDDKGTVLAYNKAEEEMSRISHRKTIGLNFFRDVAPCAQVKDFQERFEDFMREHKAFERFDFTYRFKRKTVPVVITFSRLDEKRALVIAQKADEVQLKNTA